MWFICVHPVFFLTRKNCKVAVGAPPPLDLRSVAAAPPCYATANNVQILCLRSLPTYERVAFQYGAPFVKLCKIKFCIAIWLNYMQYNTLLQFSYIAAICVKLLQFNYIAAICVKLLQFNCTIAAICVELL